MIGRLTWPSSWVHWEVSDLGASTQGVREHSDRLQLADVEIFVEFRTSILIARAILGGDVR